MVHVNLRMHGWRFVCQKMRIFSTMESLMQTKISEVFYNQEWQLSTSNHGNAIELRLRCAQVTIHDRDHIIWDGAGSKKLSISDIWHTIRPTSNSQPWERVVWHTFSVPKYSFLLWLVIKQRLLTRDRMQLLE